MTLPGALARLPPGLTARLGLASIGAVTIGFILICGAVLLDARRDATAQAATEARNIATSVAQEVGRNLDLYDISLEAVVHGLQFPGLKSVDPQLRQLILFDRAAKAPYFSFINAIDETGAVIADSESTTPRTGNWAGRDYFVAQRNDARDQLFIGAPFLTQPGQPATMSISRRMSHPDGSFAGVVVGTLRLAYFHDLFAGLTLGPHATIELLRSDGMILTRLPFNPGDIGQMLPAGAPFFSAPGGGHVNAEDPTDHLRRHFLFQRIGSLPLVVGVGLADVDIYAAWRGKAEAIGGVVAALAMIDMLLLMVVRYALTRREIGLAALRRGDAQRATLAAQREKAIAAEAQMAAVKTRFLATMSHELRTPLNSILGYAQLLSLEGNLEPVQAARVAAMRGAGDHMRDVISRVLDFSRVEADDRPPPTAPADLADLLEQCRAIAEPMAAAKGLSLTCAMAPAAPRRVMADAASIRQVLLNLLGNAVKFTEHGGVTLRITRGAEGTRFVVTDTGIGVPDIQRERLFQPYERLDADRLGVPGTGLGLAIAARLVARMGGRIGHDDNPQGGSVFWFELPLGLATTEQSLEPITTLAPATRPLRVLVADDSAMNRDVAAALLRTGGHEVTEAEDGDAALRLVAAEIFDIVLMDLRMPVLDGVEATRHIRALPGQHGQTPIIAVTADVQEDQGAALRAAGFQAWLVKPIDQMSLLSAVALATGIRNAAPAPTFAAPAGASRAPQPDQPPKDVPSPDMQAAETTMQFPEAIAPEMSDHHLEVFTTQVEALMDLLDSAYGEHAPVSVMGRPRHSALSELAHRIAGDGAQLGFMALPAAARSYAAACHQDGTPLRALAAALRDAAGKALDVLHQRRDFRRCAAMSSAKLP